MKRIVSALLLLFLTGVPLLAQQMGNAATAVSKLLITDKVKNDFFRAVKSNKLAEVTKLANGRLKLALMNIADEKGKTPLMYASEKGYFSIVKYLTQHGALVNTTDKNNWTALCYAAQNNRPNTLKHLLNLNAHVNYECGKDENDKKPPLFISAGKGANPTMISSLIEHKANVNWEDRHGETPLMQAAAEGNVQSIALLVKAGANVNARVNDGYGMSVGYFAIMSGNLDAVKYILNHGGNFPTFYDDDAMISAVTVARPYPEIVKYLNENGYK